MMNILLQSATHSEIEYTLSYLSQHKPKNISIEVCISGVGMVNTAYELGRRSLSSFDLAIQAGIAGSFGKQALGALVNVTSDCFCEMGAEDDEHFLRIDDLNLGSQLISIIHPFEIELINELPQVFGITVNKVHGNIKSIEQIRQRLQPDVESMEGAAFIHAANQSGWPALQVRAISNFVEKRNKDNWNIPLALKSLNNFLIHLFKTLDGN